MIYFRIKRAESPDETIHHNNVAKGSIHRNIVNALLGLNRFIKAIKNETFTYWKSLDRWNWQSPCTVDFYVETVSWQADIGFLDIGFSKNRRNYELYLVIRKICGNVSRYREFNSQETFNRFSHGTCEKLIEYFLSIIFLNLNPWSICFYNTEDISPNKGNI